MRSTIEDEDAESDAADAEDEEVRKLKTMKSSRGPHRGKRGHEVRIYPGTLNAKTRFELTNYLKK